MGFQPGKGVLGAGMAVMTELLQRGLWHEVSKEGSVVSAAWTVGGDVAGPVGRRTRTPGGRCPGHSSHGLPVTTD